MGLITITWVVAAVAGLFLGGFVLHFPGSYGESTFGPPAAVFGLILGAVNGAVVGLLLGLAIRAPRRVIGRLTLAMAGAVGVTHAIFDGSSTVLPLVAYALIAGIVVAAIFARLFDERSAISMAVIGLGWAGGIVLATLAGGWLGLPWTETPMGWAIDHATDGVGTALVWSIATAAIGLPGRLRTWRASA